MDACAKPNLSDVFIHTINTKVSELDVQLKELHQRKKEIQASQETILNDQLQLDVIARGLSYFKENFENLSIHERRELIRLLVDRIEWDGAEIPFRSYASSP